MRARPGRLLPSVVVGGLLISGLALGAGTASAADDPSGSGTPSSSTAQLLQAGDTCTMPIVGDAVAVPGVVQGADCVDAATKLVVLGKVADSTEEKALQKTAADKAAAKAKADKAAADKTAADKKAADKAAADKAADAEATRLKQQQAMQQGAASLPPAAVGAAPAALAAAGPVGALPPLAGVAPAGLASNLFSANTYDPGLLFGSPLGDAASALFSPKADSDVSTVSQAQALSAPGGGGYGTPATIGVIILACLIGIAVRHRVISRMKNREVPAVEYQPRHAAPEEPVQHEEPAADEARTLVVLTRR